MTLLPEIRDQLLDTAFDSAKPRKRAPHPRWTRRLTLAVPVIASAAIAAVFLSTLHGSTTSPSRSLTASRNASAAHVFYAPVKRFETSTRSDEQALVQKAKQKDANRIDACQSPYTRQLFMGYVEGHNPRYELYRLYENGTLMEQYQSGIAPVRSQLVTLANSWKALDTANPHLNSFAHASAGELRADFTLPKFNSCAFVDALAAHDFSYTWARSSSYALTIDHFYRQITAAGDKAGAFWRYIYGRHFNPTHPDGSGGKLFTQTQLTVLANLPGQLG